jgi:hypothetical protein
MPSNRQLKVLVFIVLFLVWAVVWIEGQRLSAHSVSHAFSYVVTILWALLFCWNRWLWSWPVIRWLSRRPNLKGTWKGFVQSDWPNQQADKKAESIDVYVVIRQTYSTLNVRLFSRESSSVSLCATLLSDAENIYQIAVMYLNTPTTLHVEKSPISHGGMLLNIRGGDPVQQLDGGYWTDRRTKGEIKLAEHAKVLCTGFDNAQRTKFHRTTK